jgi:hypothetical protein
MDYSNQIMILEIFEEPIGKNQTYTGKYIKEMQWLILNHLLSIARQNSELLDADGYMEYKTTYSQMLNKELKLISPYLKEHIDEDFLLDSFFTSKFPEYFQQQGAKFNLRFLYNKLYDRVKSALSTALKKLDKLDEMIDLEELYIVKVDDSKNGQWYWKEIHSQKEKTYIKNTRKSVAESLGYKNSWDCLYHGKQNEFEERLFNRVFIEQGWTEVRFRLSIGFNINHILKYIGEYTDVCSYKKILNDAIAFSMNQAALKAYQKDNDKFFQARDAYVIERKRVCVEQTIEEIQEEYDSEYGYNRIFREGFTDSQSLIIGYVVNPDDVRLEELKAYRRDWLKEHLKEYQKERLEDAYNSEELLRDEDELFMDAE